MLSHRNNATQRKPKSLALGASILLGASALTSAAFAQDADRDWQVRASLYAFTPDVSTSAALPVGGTDIDVDAGDLIDHTDAAFMGAIEAQHGRFGVYGDALYFKLSNTVTDATQLSVGGGTPLPPGVNLDGNAEIKLWIFTLAGDYRIYQSDRSNVDLIAGARLLKLDTNLNYAFNTSFGPITAPLQTGATGASSDTFDAIVGVKGRTAFGTSRAWFVQYYADVGLGDSDVTWQASAGLGRSFGPAEVTLGYHHLSYEFGDDGAIQDLDFDGPSIGVAYNF